ncbi:MAG: Gfo/Idh/MocA family oxidoreductase [Cyclobacteriaceae bacterium]
MDQKEFDKLSSRRKFFGVAGTGVAAMAMAPGFSMAGVERPRIQSFQEVAKAWVPISDRKVRVGLVGYGASKFGAAFGFQNHPNVEVVAVSDLFPDRCAALAKVTGCKKTYPSLEELVKDANIEAVFVATDAPSHPRHCIEVLKHGKHVATAVPVAFGSIEEGEQLLKEVKKSGRKFMMFETSFFRENLYAMRQIYNAGGFGKLVYTEGEYYHGASLNPQQGGGTPSYKDWRKGVPPQWYPTHSNAYYIGVTGGSFTEVNCMGMRNDLDPASNQYHNPFKTEIALFRTSEGGMSRMAVSWETPGTSTETGRVRGTEGSYDKTYEGRLKNLPDLTRPPLPPGVPDGGHGGSHGRLMNEFIMSILEDRQPLVDIVMALNMTVPGIVAHASAMKDGELMKIPQYKLLS